MGALFTTLAAATPIQETLHVTRYPASIWVLILMQSFLVLPVVLVSIAMLFLHRAQQTGRSLRLLILAVAWSIAALTTACWPLLGTFFRAVDVKILMWLPMGIVIFQQILFLFFAVDLVVFCRNLFYGISS
jgi:hypothetical protein